MTIDTQLAISLVRAKRMVAEKDYAGICLAIREGVRYRNHSQRLEISLRDIYEYLAEDRQDFDKIDIMRAVTEALEDV